MRAGVSHHMANRHFLRALYVSKAYDRHFEAMVFVEAKQNGTLSCVEDFCFILPRLVSKKRAKVLKQNIVGEARAVNAMQPHGRGQPRRRGRGKGGADTGTPDPTPGERRNRTPNSRECTACGRTGHTEAQCWERHPHWRPTGKDRRTGAGDGIPPGMPAPGNLSPEGPKPQIPSCLECGKGRHPPDESTRSFAKQPCGLVRPARVDAPERGKGQ